MARDGQREPEAGLGEQGRCGAEAGLAAAARRLVIVVLVGVSVAWIPVLQGSNSGQLFIYLQSVTSSLAPPVTAIFILGIFWRRASEQVGGTDRSGGVPLRVPCESFEMVLCLSFPQGAFWGLMAGLLVGALRLVLEFLHPEPHCGQADTRPALLRVVHYLHFAIALFLLTCAVVAAGSLLSPPPQQRQVRRPCLQTLWTSGPSPDLSLMDSRLCSHPGLCPSPTPIILAVG